MAKNTWNPYIYPSYAIICSMVLVFYLQNWVVFFGIIVPGRVRNARRKSGDFNRSLANRWFVCNTNGWLTSKKTWLYQQKAWGLSENDEKTTKNPQVEPYVSMKIRVAIKQNGISKPIFIFWTNWCVVRLHSPTFASHWRYSSQESGGKVT